MPIPIGTCVEDIPSSHHEGICQVCDAIVPQMQVAQVVLKIGKWILAKSKHGIAQVSKGDCSYLGGVGR